MHQINVGSEPQTLIWEHCHEFHYWYPNCYASNKCWLRAPDPDLGALPPSWAGGVHLSQGFNDFIQTLHLAVWELPYIHVLSWLHHWLSPLINCFAPLPPPPPPPFPTHNLATGLITLKDAYGDGFVLTQFHYLEWPIGNVPSSCPSLLDLLLTCMQWQHANHRDVQVYVIMFEPATSHVDAALVLFSFPPVMVWFVLEPLFACTVNWPEESEGGGCC